MVLMLSSNQSYIFFYEKNKLPLLRKNSDCGSKITHLKKKGLGKNILLNGILGSRESMKHKSYRKRAVDVKPLDVTSDVSDVEKIGRATKNCCWQIRT